MHMTSLRVRNVRGIPDAERGVDLEFASKGEPVPRWVVLAGRNGAGKSTLLRAVASTIAGPGMARVLAESFRGWIREDASHAIAASRLRFTDEDYFGSGRKPTFEPWVAVRWERTSGPEPQTSRELVGGRWTPERGPWADNPRGWFVAGYGPFRRISAAPTEALRLMMSPGRPAALASLFREDASLSESIQWLQQKYLQRLEGRTEAAEIETFILHLLNDGLLPDGITASRVTSEGLWVDDPDGVSVVLNELSDGYRIVAGLVLDLIKQFDVSQEGLAYSIAPSPTVQNSGVVLIDEIDVHLHIDWQKRIGFWLKEHFPNIQFIISTHSPFICQAADPGGLVRLTPPWEGGPAAVIIGGEEYRRIVNGTADEAVLTSLFGVDSVLSEKALKLRRRLAELEVKGVLESLSSEETDEKQALQEKLPNTQAATVSRQSDQLLDDRT